MVIRMSARKLELLDIIYNYETEYRKKHSISPLVSLEDFIYEDAPQEVIDAYEEIIDDSQDTYEYQ